MKKETKTNNMPATDGFRPAHIGERAMPVHTISTGDKILVMHSDGTIQVTTKVESSWGPADIRRSVKAILSVAGGKKKAFVKAADEKRFEELRKFINQNCHGILAERDVLEKKVKFPNSLPNQVNERTPLKWIVEKKVKFPVSLLNSVCSFDYEERWKEYNHEKVLLSDVVKETTLPIVILPAAMPGIGEDPEFRARQKEWYKSVKDTFPEHKRVMFFDWHTTKAIRNGGYSEKLVIFAVDVLPRNLHLPRDG